MIFRPLFMLVVVTSCARPALSPAPAPPVQAAARASFEATPEEPAIDEARFAFIVRGNERRGTDTFSLHHGQAGGFSVEAHGEDAAGVKTYAFDVALDAPLHVVGGEVARGDARQRLEPNGALLRALGPGDAEERGDRNDLFMVPELRASLAIACLIDTDVKRAFTSFPRLPLRIEARGDDPLSPSFPALHGERSIRHLGVGIASRLYDVACAGPRLVAARFPQQSALVREGYEALLPSLEARHWPRPALPKGLVAIERRVAVAAGGLDAEAVLACTLVLPDPSTSDAPYPAVAFATGTGPQDRDENSPGVGGLKVSLFDAIATRLAKAGIASLRCDDRGIGESIGSQTGITFETSARDARAMLDALARDKAIDPHALGIVGHSEGGLIAADLAATGRKLIAVVLLSSPGRRIDLTLREQVRTHHRTAGDSPEIVAEEDRKAAHLYDAVRTTGHLPYDLPPGLAEKIAPRMAWLVSHLARDPEAVARSIPHLTSVLAARGAEDTQVFDADLEALRRALDVRGRTRFVAITYPGLNHCFSRGIAGDRSSCEDPAHGVDEGMLDDVVRFVAASFDRRAGAKRGACVGHASSESSDAIATSGVRLRSAARSIP